MALNLQVEENQALLISQYYSDLYTQLPQGETRGRRRRKKARGAEPGGVAWKKRRLSDEQVKFLEMNFGNEHKLESARKDRLAMELGLDSRQVAVWFQNRRARWKSKQLEEEYVRLKNMHEATVVDKCKLEAEVLKLRDQLSEAQEKVRTLSEQSDGAWEGERSCCSPSSSVSMDAHPTFFGEFGVENSPQDFFIIPENCHNIDGMEWLDLFGP
ncbi:hypothetical protein AAC387_Pa02g3587 [Persea americana]